MVRYSVKPWPTLPSAKYHVGCTGPGGRLGNGVPVGVGDGVLVPVVVGVGVGVVPAGISATLPLFSSVTHTLLLPSTASPSRWWAPGMVATTAAAFVVGLSMSTLLLAESLYQTFPELSVPMPDINVVLHGLVVHALSSTGTPVPPTSSETRAGVEIGSLYQTLPAWSKVIKCALPLTAVSVMLIMVVAEEKCPTFDTLFCENHTTSCVES